jgi:HlyD family secretion protein
MDRKIEKKYWSRKRVTMIVGGILLALIGTYAIQTLNKKTYRLDRDRITIKKVEESEFQDIILIPAVVEPIASILVNNPEGGTVEEIYVEDGDMVKKGNPLLKLNNPAVMLAYMTQETAIMEQINNLRNLKLSLDRDQRSLSESLIDVEYQLTDKQRLHRVDSQLYHEAVIAKTQYDDISGQLNYQQKKHAFLIENVAKTKDDNSLQIKRINQSIAMMERNLHVIHDNIDKMLVRAPVDGRLSSFDPVIGESFSNNQTIGKIDVLAGYKIIGQVDEYYLSTTKVGLSARFSFDDQLIELKVKKVLPEVNGGRFEIELEFVSEAPSAITIGQSVQVRLELSESKQALIIPRGAFFHSFGGKYVYVLNELGEAEKRQIRIGRQNPSYYEVLDGLMKGEQIITSSYEAFKDFETITIINQ